LMSVYSPEAKLIPQSLISLFKSTPPLLPVAK
jgi:hypothetical protein